MFIFTDRTRFARPQQLLALTVSGHAVTTVLTKTGKLKTDQSKHQKKVAATQNNMKKNYLKLISSAFIVGAFLLVAYGSGDDEKKAEWKKNSKESFCGKEFKSSHTIEAIDMTTKVVTILNCDGTYTSKEDWGTSKRNEETYNNTVGRSSGNNGDFSGTWEIADSNIPSEVDTYFRTGGFKEADYTIIRYHSNKGKTRYAYIQHDEKISLYLGLVTFDRDNYEEKTYREEDLDMYSGLTD